MNPTHDGSQSGRQTSPPRFASAGFVLAGVSFCLGGAIVARTEVPPSLSPRLGMASHALWALAVTLLAAAAYVSVRSIPELRDGLAGELAVGALGLGVIQGLQWASWAYVDVRGSREETHDLVLETLIVPFGAGHLLVYGLLVGTGVTLLGWALRSTSLTRRAVDWIGVVLGGVTVLLWTVVLLFAFGGGGDGNALFDVATLLLPVLYLWGIVVGVELYRPRQS